jgi:GNAT superfamily N-acetyltransferase
MTVRLDSVLSGEASTLPPEDRCFRVDSRLAVTALEGTVTYRTEILPVPRWKTYPAPQSIPERVFAAFDDDRLLGRIDLSRHWTEFGSIEDLVVAQTDRRRGIGRALIEAAQGWATQVGLPGLRAETQDVNVPACQLYASCAFVLHGLDMGLYGGNSETAGEVALFWYWRVPRS